MHRLLASLSLCAVLAASAAAQTTGVPGQNDVTLNHAGSGGTSCVNTNVSAGTLLEARAMAAANAPLILSVADSCVPGAVVIDANYSSDLDPGSLVHVLDGTGSLIPPDALTSFSKTDGGGFFYLGGCIPSQGSFAFQFGFVSPSFANGLGTSQAHSVTQTISGLTSGATDLSPISDDGQVMINFAGGGFSFYGTTQSTVFVNMNGNLTFGSGDTDWTPTAGEHLNDQPRIAPAWADWVPNDATQGTVRAINNSTRLTVEWFDVRSFGTTECTGIGDSNTFVVDLHKASGQITFSYGVMRRCLHGTLPNHSMVVGLSPGGGLSGPNDLDLSLGGHAGANNQAMYEVFSAPNPFDMDAMAICEGTSVVFTPSSGGYSANIQ